MVLSRKDVPASTESLFPSFILLVVVIPPLFSNHISVNSVTYERMLIMRCFLLLFLLNWGVIVSLRTAKDRMEVLFSGFLSAVSKMIVICANSYIVILVPRFMGLGDAAEIVILELI